MIDKEQIQAISKSFEEKTPQEILSWALGEFQSDIALACSFGPEDVALVDMVASIRKDAKIFYLDTDLLFKDTYSTRDQLIKKYGITPIRYSPKLNLKQQAKQYGEKLWERDPDLCCKLRKVEPLQDALKPLKAWITGMRRDQSPTRANIGIVEVDKKFGLIKVNPLARWTSDNVWDYIRRHGVPYNPLHDKGYPSIGCEPCTAAVKPGEDPRSGRWKGSEKTECGLHK